MHVLVTNNSFLFSCHKLANGKTPKRWRTNHKTHGPHASKLDATFTLFFCSLHRHFEISSLFSSSETVLRYIFFSKFPKLLVLPCQMTDKILPWGYSQKKAKDWRNSSRLKQGEKKIVYTGLYLRRYQPCFS